MNRIKEVLKEKGISQTWLAKKLDKSYNTINEYTRNVRQPSIEVLYQIAKILEVSAKDLLKES
jgi:putative transcriptional regulator